MTSILRLVRAVAALATATVPLATTAPAQDLLVRAAHLVTAPDNELSDSAMLVRGGKVAYVGRDIPAEALAQARVVDYGNATVTPGLVLAIGTLDRDRDLAEAALAFTPDLRAAEAFDPWNAALRVLPQDGVTALGWAPSQRNLAGGIAALVKPGSERGRIAEAELFVALSLTKAARNPEREPTSLMGARELLTDAFRAARRGVEIGPDLAVLRQVVTGARKVLLHADTFAELQGALALAAEFGFRPVLVGAREADKLLPKLAASGAAIVLDTLQPEARLAELQLPARLAEAGVPFCFAGRPECMRLSAALAVRHGLDRRTALGALTRTPAALLGQEAAIGSLRQGCAADFVVFDGDLLDLAARHVATWIDGERVAGTAGAPRRAANTTTAADTAMGDR